MGLEILRSLVSYNHWANDLLLDLAEQVPVEKAREPLGGSSFDSIHGTAAHILQGERFYYARWVGADIARGGRPSETQDIAELRTHWLTHRQRIDAFVGELTSERLQQPLRYSRRDGNAYELPLWKVMLQMLNHGTHHRAELADLLTRSGLIPPATDLIVYYEAVAGPVEARHGS